MGPLLDPERTTVEARTIDRPVALLSVDVETDYGSGLDEALSQTGRLLDLLARLGVPLTAFVEGQFFKRRRSLCRLLLDAGVDVQLHCYDHAEPGDTPASLRRGALALEDCCGRRAAGYRAHTYRLTHELYETLLELGFRWDSSLMRGVGQGRNRHRVFREGDYFLLGGRLFEFPVATWRGTPLPLNHAYRLLLKAPAEAGLWAVSGPGPLVAYNMHMTDLVRCASLARSPSRGLPRLLHRYMWATQGRDTLAALETLVTRLRRAGYEFLTTHALYERLAEHPHPAGRA
jgi:peptidoglycan/xylan/chitin deacetylase (PgdA/CDA1 family)